MTGRDVRSRITRRGAKAGVTVPPELGDALAAYLDVLARWNRKLNLTGLAVDPPTNEAVDRLIVEPLVAARFVRPADRMCLDIGSGGGSPAIPLKLAVPDLRMIMVEVKVRKSAFLRKAVRALALQDASVENLRVEELLARPGLHEASDLVTLRAVRADRRLFAVIHGLLRPCGRIFSFGGKEDAEAVAAPFSLEAREPLVPARGSALMILRKG